MWFVVIGAAVLLFALLKKHPVVAGGTSSGSSTAPVYKPSVASPETVGTVIAKGSGVTTAIQAPVRGVPPASVNTPQGAPIVTYKASSLTSGYFKGIS